MFAKIKKLLNNKDATPSVAAIELKKKGDACVREENYQQAVSYYQQAVKISPQFVDALIGLGYALIESGFLDEATPYLTQVLSISPDHIDAYFMLGNIAHSKGEHQTAIDHYNKVLKYNPQFEFAYYQLFKVYQALGSTNSALDVLEKLSMTVPTSIEFLLECAWSYLVQSHFQYAIRIYLWVYKLSPNNVTCIINLAQAYMLLHQDHMAIPYLKQLIDQGIKDVRIYEQLGNVYVRLHKKQEALAIYGEVLRIDPEHPVKHMVASLSGLTTETAPTEYVEKLFDGYAESFESHLTKALHYNTPSRLLSLIQSCMELDHKKLDVIDLGCGTGLFGKVIAPYANQIVGVDLSSKMLDKAAELQIYQRLEHKELLEMMRKEPDGSYDLVAATDVFVYIGSLDELVVEVKRLLRKDGFFAFSTESLEALNLASSDDKGFILNNTGRYAHAKSYLDKLAQKAGFNVVETKDDVIRMNLGKAIDGYLSLWQVIEV